MQLSTQTPSAAGEKWPSNYADDVRFFILFFTNKHGGKKTSADKIASAGHIAHESPRIQVEIKAKVKNTVQEVSALPTLGRPWT